MSKKWKRSLLLLLSMMLLLAGTSYAAPEAEKSIIDYTRTGRLTLQKFTEASEVTDLAGQDLAEYLQQNPGALTPLPNVTFRYLKIGDAVQYSKDDNVVTIGYSVDSAATEYLNLTDEDVASVVDNKKIYDVSVLDEKLNLKTATETERYMDNQDAAAMPKTNSEGKSTVDHLPLGLYLIAEYSYPSTAIADEDHCAPFLVALPSSDGVNGKWLYDLTVAPKNILAPIHNDKKIVGNDGNETTEIDSEIGKPINFILRSDIPHAVGKLETFRLTDTLSEGLNFDQDNYLVYGVTDSGARVRLSDTGHFTFTEENNVFVWDFDCKSLADEDGWSSYDSVEIYYTASLNSKAVVGGQGNPNEFKTDYSRFTNTENSPLETITPPPVRVFTYALNIHKIDSNTKAPLEGVKFRLVGANYNPIYVAEQISGSPGAYYTDDKSGSDVMTTDLAGNLTINGLDAGTYYIEEVEPAPGFTPLSKKIEIVITSNENTYTKDNNGTIFRVNNSEQYVTDIFPRNNVFYAPIDSAGNTVPNGTYISSGVSTIQTVNGDHPELFMPDPLKWSANYFMDNGTVKVEIENRKILIPPIPQTGDHFPVGLSVLLFAMGVIGLIVSIRNIYMLHRRNSRKES